MPQRTVETAHGTVEYETVDCDSCGNEVKKDLAVPFKIGEREGVACPHCEDVGPVSFPHKGRQKLLHWFGKIDDVSIYFFIIFFPLIFIMSITAVILKDNTNVDSHLHGVGWAAWAFVVWFMILHGIYVFV